MHVVLHVVFLLSGGGGSKRSDSTRLSLLLSSAYRRHLLWTPLLSLAAANTARVVRTASGHQSFSHSRRVAMDRGAATAGVPNTHGIQP